MPDKRSGKQDCTEAANPNGISGREWCYVEVALRLRTGGHACLFFAVEQLLITSRSRSQTPRPKNGIIALPKLTMPMCASALDTLSRKKQMRSQMQLP